jgi:hypothetical protein
MSEIFEGLKTHIEYNFSDGQDLGFCDFRHYIPARHLNIYLSPIWSQINRENPL